MNCPLCQGAGCAACQGDKPGFGLGPGRGQGDRPEEKHDTAPYDSQVKGQLTKGSGVVTGEADGPNYKGRVAEAIQQDFDTARRGATDPLTSRRIPRKHREHAREYFDRFREGE